MAAKFGTIFGTLFGTTPFFHEKKAKNFRKDSEFPAIYGIIISKIRKTCILSMSCTQGTNSDCAS
jgi:hypothetical protein